jgi:hypothetical protein
MANLRACIRLRKQWLRSLQQYESFVAGLASDLLVLKYAYTAYTNEMVSSSYPNYDWTGIGLAA